MALTVRPDDEVYQFDTVWLGPDEYTLPIQARYVAWGTWLACFLVAAVVLIPIGGNGPSGVLGSLVWALGLSVVLSRAVMLVVDHERPLRSLPALFSAEARAALQARRRAERALLVRPGKIRVRETPPKVVAMRERQRTRTAARVERSHPAPVEVPVADLVVVEPDWTPDTIEYAEPTPSWSVPTDVTYDPDSDTYVPVPVTYGAAYPATPHVTVPEPIPAPAAFVPAPTTAARPAPAHTAPAHATPAHATSPPRPGQAANPARPTNPGRPAKPGQTPDSARIAYPGSTDPGWHSAPEPAVPVVAAAVASDAPRPNPFRVDPHHPDDRPAPYRGPVTVGPTDGRHARAARTDAADGPAPDGQAAIEARILLPARKDR